LLKSREGIAGVLEWCFNLGNWSMNIFCSLVHDTTGTSILLCLMGRCAWIGIWYTLLILSLGFGRQCKHMYALHHKYLQNSVGMAL
jgi:hypothetical protein